MKELMILMLVLGLPFSFRYVESTNFSTKEKLEKEAQYKKDTHWKTLSPSTFEGYKDIDAFAKYWYKTAVAFEKAFGLPKEFMLAKMWHETNGGLAGVGRKGAYFGIKGKGHKGYDPKDKEKVEYRSYKQRWEAFSHFCNLVGYRNPMYRERYAAWKAHLPMIEDYVLWALALQVHPDVNSSKGAYALNGCRDGRNIDCYRTRVKSAQKVINYAKIIRDIPGFMD